MSDAGSFELNITLGDSAFQASGDSNVVMKALAEFKGMVGETPPAQRHRDKGEGAGKEPDPNKKIPLGTFMKRTFPKQAANATAIITWAKRHDGKASLKPSQVEGYWKKLGKKPGNISQVCINAEGEGWLHNDGGGLYSVTEDGEAMVDALPKTG